MHVSERLAAELAQQRAVRRGLGEPVRQPGQPPRALRDHRSRRSGQQTGGAVDAFVASVGTGGTLAGVGMALKERKPSVRIVLADPMGSALYHYYAHGELKAEGTSITEGIGQGRVTKNLEGAPIDGALQITDAEALPIIFDLLAEEGLVVGGSTGINVAGAIAVARQLGPGPYGRDGAVRLRHALPEQAVQPRVPAREGPAGAGMAGMTPHPNAIRIRELFAAFRSRRHRHGPRRHPRARGLALPRPARTARRDRTAGATRSSRSCSTCSALTDGTFHLDLIDVLANDAHAVALFRGHGERDGKTLDNPTCLRMRMENGQVVEVWEFVWDLFAVDEFWS